MSAAKSATLIREAGVPRFGLNPVTTPSSTPSFTRTLSNCLDRAATHLGMARRTISGDLLKRASPLRWGHISLTDIHSWDTEQCAKASGRFACQQQSTGGVMFLIHSALACVLNRSDPELVAWQSGTTPCRGQPRRRPPARARSSGFHGEIDVLRKLRAGAIS